MKKLTDDQVREILRSAEGATTLGRRYGVNKRTVQRIRDGVLRKDVEIA